MFTNLKIIILTFFVISFSAMAQEIPFCYSDQVMQLREQQDPSLKLKREEADKLIYELIQKRGTKKKKAVIVIPVVVHVVYNNGPENVSEARIRSQIDVLNEDFRMMNADTGDTRSVFKSLMGDAQIEFCLATRDPNGCYTNGITRTYTTTGSFDPNLNFVKSNATGGEDPWPSDEYLNMWICDLISPIGGQGEFPWIGTPLTDGIQLDYFYFGTIGGTDPSNTLGRTATHEVGHWLGLYHNFQDGCVGVSAATCATMGDRVCDTPPQSVPLYNCPVSPNTCAEVPTDNPDMYENFMDYTDDDCKSLFTQGQVNRMQAVIDTYRTSLTTSIGCNYAAPGYPVNEGFQGATFVPGCWKLDNVNGDATWSQNGIGAFGNSSASAKMDFYNVSISGRHDYLIMRMLDFSALMPPISLTFAISYARYDNSRYDSLKVEVSTDGGDIWQIEWSKAGSSLATAPNTTVPYLPVSVQWRQETINLDAYSGATGMLIRFHGISGRGNNLYLDDINITGNWTNIAQVESAEEEIIVYPVPTTGLLIIEGIPVYAKGTAIKLYNTLGTLVYIKELNEITLEEVELDLSSLSNGVYLVVMGGESHSFSKRIIISR